ncbi:uncharacterized protein EDB91DRAFT_1088462 [Suillus paluster]|uniref:uncharacterized protein n=1 Tax=Suillus paluster TaxID=48578 RepID=UPI001B85BE7D|nr:uncharacterized protein EDB91DRAFT_1088462 [Suillus paluster]KAG1721387.1 hypothetical protein EDB91DRAFT_1088462 [Suillus paluster]
MAARDAIKLELPVGVKTFKFTFECRTPGPVTIEISIQKPLQPLSSQAGAVDGPDTSDMHTETPGVLGGWLEAQKTQYQSFLLDIVKAGPPVVDDSMTEPESEPTAEDIKRAAQVFVSSTGQLVDTVDDSVTEPKSDSGVDPKQEAQTPVAFTCFYEALLVSSSLTTLAFFPQLHRHTTSPALVLAGAIWDPVGPGKANQSWSCPPLGTKDCERERGSLLNEKGVYCGVPITCSGTGPLKKLSCWGKLLFGTFGSGDGWGWLWPNWIHGNTRNEEKSEREAMGKQMANPRKHMDLVHNLDVRIKYLETRTTLYVKVVLKGEVTQRALASARALRPLPEVSVIDTSHFVFWLCGTSLNPDAVFAATKRIPDVPFPTDGYGTAETWGKLFRLVQDGLNSSSLSPSVLVYAKALTSLYFTAYARKFHISPFTGEDGSKEVAGLCHSVDVNRSQDGKSLLFLLTVLQQWFDIVDGKSCSSPIPEDKVIISELRTANTNLDDIPDDVLEWLLPIDRPRCLPSHKTIVTCLYVMIAILDWWKINLEEIKITDNRLDITAAIQGDPNPTLQHPEVTSSGILSRLPLSIFSPSPRSHTFSETEVLHFRAILEPLARLVCETEFRSCLEIDRVKAWGLDVFNTTKPQCITDASIPAFCLAACCAMDDLLKSGIPYSRMVWGSAAPWKANVDASVLLGYLGRVEGTEIQNSIPPAYALLILSADAAIFTPKTTASLVPFIISTMEWKASPLLRHVGLKIAHVIREVLVNITEGVRDELLPALRSATFGNIQGDCVKLDDTSPDRFVHLECDLHYLEILFALAKNYAWPEWDVWFVARPDNQVLLTNQAWKYPHILDECLDVVPLLITFTNKMLSSLDDVSKGDLAKLDKDTAIDALGGISEQVQMVLDAHVDVDGMQSALEALGTKVAHSRDELLRKCVHSD